MSIYLRMLFDRKENMDGREKIWFKNGFLAVEEKSASERWVTRGAGHKGL